MKVAKYFKKLANKPAENAIVPKPMALEMLDIKAATLDNWVKKGTIGKIKIGSRQYILAHDIIKVFNDREEQKEKIEATIEKCAKNKRMITYSELMETADMSSSIPNDRRKIAHILGDISAKTAEKDGFLLSALVVYKGKDIPGDGFFELVTELAKEHDLIQGPLSSDDESRKIWLVDHIKQIFAHYEKK